MDRRKNKKEQKRLLEAKKNFRSLQKEITPFIKRRKIEINSTIGKWCETSDLLYLIKE